MKAVTEGCGVEETCRAMAEAVYAQYPVGAAKTL